MCNCASKVYLSVTHSSQPQNNQMQFNAMGGETQETLHNGAFKPGAKIESLPLDSCDSALFAYRSRHWQSILCILGSGTVTEERGEKKRPLKHF